MDAAQKRDFTVTAVLFSVAIISIRSQVSSVTVGAILGLVFVSLWTGRTAILAVLAATLVFLYPGSQAGWIYRRGSHVGVHVTQQILVSGWPLPALDIARGFPETPLVHFHAIAVHLVTGLRVKPSTQPHILATWLLPLWYVSVTLLACGITVRQYKQTHALSTALPRVSYLLIPVVLWIPLYNTKTGFTRQSMGIALFAIAVYVLFRLYKRASYRFVGLSLFLLFSLISAHHLTSFILNVLVAVVVAGVILQRRSRVDLPGRQLTGSTVLVLYLTTVLLFLAWQFVFTEGGSLFTRLLATVVISGGKLGKIVTFILGESVQQQSALPLIKRGLFIRFQSFFGLWIYQGLLAFGCLALAVVLYRRRILTDDWASISVLSGVIIGTGAALSWVTGIGGINRIMTFFVLVSGWLAPAGVSLVAKRMGESSVTPTRIFVFVMAVLGLCLVPPYVVGFGEPRYEQGETDQRFPAQYFASGEFVANHVTESTGVIGDENAEHVLISTAGRQAGNSPYPIVNGTVPPNSVLLLFDYNDQLFFGSHFSTGRYAISMDEMVRPIQTNQSQVYTNGRVDINR
ncbi:hypothetical protein HZS55_05925 [Halosimplex rubrum]|uniref:DUF2206 domain-containing protein n=1 Tax=Halosimplex rubrum TaxID=869889 RepID=A0A7D5T4D7_9EURY|nr:hypothetical protein [Halosimplex rubrum]QLH76869.1 hypothetical protein HZS55_05925 [Halosimplex rubrum]